MPSGRTRWGLGSKPVKFKARGPKGSDRDEKIRAGLEKIEDTLLILFQQVKDVEHLLDAKP